MKKLLVLFLLVGLALNGFGTITHTISPAEYDISETDVSFDFTITWSETDEVEEFRIPIPRCSAFSKYEDCPERYYTQITVTGDYPAPGQNGCYLFEGIPPYKNGKIVCEINDVNNRSISFTLNAKNINDQGKIARRTDDFWYLEIHTETTQNFQIQKVHLLKPDVEITSPNNNQTLNSTVNFTVIETEKSTIPEGVFFRAKRLSDNKWFFFGDDQDRTNGWGVEFDSTEIGDGDYSFYAIPYFTTPQNFEGDWEVINITIDNTTPQPSPAPSPTPSSTPSTTPSATPSITPSPTPSSTPSSTPSATPSPTPSQACVRLTNCPDTKECGTMDDGCGGLLSCGFCDTGSECIDNKCIEPEETPGETPSPQATTEPEPTPTIKEQPTIPKPTATPKPESVKKIVAEITNPEEITSDTKYIGATINYDNGEPIEENEITLEIAIDGKKTELEFKKSENSLFLAELPESIPAGKHDIALLSNGEKISSAQIEVKPAEEDPTGKLIAWGLVIIIVAGLAYVVMYIKGTLSVAAETEKLRTWKPEEETHFLLRKNKPYAGFQKAEPETKKKPEKTPKKEKPAKKTEIKKTKPIKNPAKKTEKISKTKKESKTQKPSANVKVVKVEKYSDGSEIREIKFKGKRKKMIDLSK